ncbi:MAG TPA: protein translocase subunit SecF [Acidobacteriota bacterium]|nr:protein translocase subunit SecF [Acidobacteriota bacterium]
MEILRNVSIDWIGKKWILFGISWTLVVVGVVGYIMRGGFAFGIDFTGGTLIYLKFEKTPDLDLIRRSLKSETATPPLIQRYGNPSDHTVQVRAQTGFGSGQEMGSVRKELTRLLRASFDVDHVNTTQTDFNNVGSDALGKYLLAGDPDNLKAQSKTTQEIDDYYKALAKAMIDYRDKNRQGLVPSLDDLKAVGASNAVITSMKKDCFAGPFAIQGVDNIGAVVGSDLRRRATLAVGLSFLGMLIYVAFRFKPIYGVAGVVALIHDIVITLGLFALTQKEISLTVIAALLTLVGYSMNDTIVIFDRVRENLRIMRKESLHQVLNLSINQTLSRTIMTSGMTFLSVFALYLFGGEVLHGFSFALTIGIIIGTYSSIGIASPIVEWWSRVTEQKSKR